MEDQQQGVEMVIGILKNWEIVIDGVQIFLCLLILLYLFRNRSKKKDQFLMNTGREPGQDFNAHVLTQTIKQQVDRAFANVIEIIAIEQDRLESALQYDLPSDDAWDISEFHLRSKLSDRNESSRKTDFADSRDKRQRHEQIQNLAAGGMSTRQISEELKAPLSEVELILSLSSENN
jgi:hypothetical protein